MKRIIIITILSLALVATGFSQEKIGYTNIELVLAYMPEAKSLEQQLDTYQKQLAEKLQVKDDYVKAKYQEYLDLKEKGQLTPDDQNKREAELMKLDGEVQKLAQDSDYKLQVKREELMAPILDKLQAAIDDVAEAGGYTVILNQTTSAGVSTILHGPEQQDVTEAIFTKLGIQMPTGN